MNRILLLFSILSCTLTLSAQKELQPRNGLLVHFQYGYHIPGKDLATRFGNNFTLGGSAEGKWNNWIAGISYDYIFGGKVKQDVLDQLDNGFGEMVGIDGHLAQPYLQERGYMVLGSIGKLFPLGNSLSHFIHVKAGAGFLQHKIKLTEEYNVLPQIYGDYAAGYDRLTNGLALQENIGYTYLSQNKRINFSLGVRLLQGFTRMRRIADFSTQTANEDPAKRLDLLNGVYLSWILPFYFQGNAEEVIY